MQKHQAELREFVPDNGSCVRTTFVSALACWQRADELGVTSSYLLSARWDLFSLG